MKEHNKNFYSLEELKRARDCYEGYQDGEEVFYFVGALRYACDEIERLNNIINGIEKEVDKLLERQYESERFAKENGFSTYLPAKENLLCVKDKIKELKGVDKE